MLRKAVLATALTLVLSACATTPGADPQAAPAAPAAAAAPVAQQVAPSPPAAPTAQERAEDALKRAVGGNWRSRENGVRDAYRNPVQTLTYFGVEPQHTVIEITPGAGWYSEILAPYLREQGQYIAAVVDPMTLAGDRRDFFLKSKTALEEKFAAAPEQFDRARVVGYDPTAPSLGPAGSADVVLTFRNVHNWYSNGQAEGMFKAFFAVLKPGGTLGIVEHRAISEVTPDDRSGYMGQAQVTAMAQAAGFIPAGHSQINANARDTKDHPNGVWTLPPLNRHDEADAAKYRTIGESDRMTLRFHKPGA
ncbi:MAG: class I SAM-dependent methyltransferase [Lysobacter sp.]|nr:class I SAM-dependent methyltransferase [Lysobacter sp.]